MIDDGTTISVRSTSTSSHCPSCGLASGRVHSHYRRQINDLPLAGRSVKPIAIVRRFRCEAVRCGQRIFAERFAEGIVAPWRGAPAALMVSFIILVLPWAAGRRQASRDD